VLYQKFGIRSRFIKKTAETIFIKGILYQNIRVDARNYGGSLIFGHAHEFQWEIYRGGEQGWAHLIRSGSSHINYLP